jgi:SAM-dependent methyltransferase
MTTLAALKGDWESLAKQDALHAILTDATRKGRGWDLDEFMATGQVEIGIVLRHLEELGRLPDFKGEALDFGCGVGRLTQPLAQRFASCVGVDISATMIQKAEALNRHAHCRYLVSSGSHLPFAAGRFSFIYCNIVLQHVPRRIATSYLREFVRVLAPNGVLVFGVQDSFRAPDFASSLTLIRNTLRIRSRIKAAFHLGPSDMQMHCLPERVIRNSLGNAKIVDVQQTNTSAKDFNGKLVYLQQPLTSGYVGKQYCVVKLTSNI